MASKRVLIVAAIAWLAAGGSALTAPGAAGRSGSIAVRGNRLVSHNHTVRLIGVNRSGAEYACSGPLAGGGQNGYAVFPAPIDARTIRAMLSWRINAVALPLNEACWLGGYGNLSPRFSGENYRAAVAGYVRRLNRSGIYVVLRLAGAAPGDHAYGSLLRSSSEEIPMADADHSLAFWRSLASRFRSNHQVLFHAFDEPHSIDWTCALGGCVADDAPEGRSRYGAYTAVGHQAIVDAIRSQGANQPIVISGIDFAGDPSQWERYMPTDPQNSLVVGFNDFDFSGNLPTAKPQLAGLARRHPVLVGGFGDSNCTSRFSRRLMRFVDSIGGSYLAWAWNTVQDSGGCANNTLLDDGDSRHPGRAYRTGRPSGYGRGVRDHFVALDAHRRYAG